MGRERNVDTKVQTYRDLTVWHRCVDFAIELYNLTASFPQEERFGLVSQLRRASVSMASNIAEGQQRGGTQDYIRFCRIARGSSAEVDTQLEIAKRLGYLDVARHEEICGELIEIRRMLGGLINSLVRNLSKTDNARESAAPYGDLSIVDPLTPES